MRNLSFGLGLAGGILGVCQGLSNMFSSLFFKRFDFPFFGHSGADNLLEGFLEDFGPAFVLPGIIVLIVAGVLGIIGATLVNKNNKTAGILMLVGGGLCVIGNFSIIVAGLLIAAGVLALVKPKADGQTTIEE